MVKAIARCVHCGAEARHPVVGVVGDRTLNFCCQGCKQVYEFLWQEGLLPLASESEKGETNAKS